MTNYKLIFSLVSFLFLMIVGILFWRTSLLFTDFAVLFTDVETGSVLDTRATSDKETISLNNSTDSNNSDSYETIEKTIARIQRDVIVTGTITGNAGQELAIFQIEGMPDSSFKINTQLMDGFIIVGITENHVVLKNQIGDETFSLQVQ